MLNSSALIKLQSVAVGESEDSEAHLQSQHPGGKLVCAFQGHTTTDSNYLSYVAQQVMASLKVNKCEKHLRRLYTFTQQHYLGYLYSKIQIFM